MRTFRRYCFENRLRGFRIPPPNQFHTLKIPGGASVLIWEGQGKQGLRQTLEVVQLAKAVGLFSQGYERVTKVTEQPL